MQVFVCTDHAGHWPVGVASVVVAADEADARALLTRELELRGLNRRPFTLYRISTNHAGTYVLRAGEY